MHATRLHLLSLLLQGTTTLCGPVPPGRMADAICRDWEDALAGDFLVNPCEESDGQLRLCGLLTPADAAREWSMFDNKSTASGWRQAGTLLATMDHRGSRGTRYVSSSAMFPQHLSSHCMPPCRHAAFLLSQRDRIDNWKAFYAGNNMVGWKDNDTLPVCEWTGVHCIGTGESAIIQQL